MGTASSLMQNQEVCTSEGGRIEGARYDLQGEEVVQEVRTRQPVSSIRFDVEPGQGCCCISTLKEGFHK
jgi:hypothetical protein